MTTVFLAECGGEQQAERFRQHFDEVSWVLNDDIQAQCQAKIRPDLEETGGAVYRSVV
ncbi:MAG: hypothetical protein HC929_15445 [Leptolyngbyaceae cyanobacterium SM2_5_2]|nr:hypothetical protein [Leptolyngbyaceae cyanobacterium SM2_5_2]